MGLDFPNSDHVGLEMEIRRWESPFVWFAEGRESAYSNQLSSYMYEYIKGNKIYDGVSLSISRYNVAFGSIWMNHSLMSNFRMLVLKSSTIWPDLLAKTPLSTTQVLTLSHLAYHTTPVLLEGSVDYLLPDLSSFIVPSRVATVHSFEIELAQRTLLKHLNVDAGL